MIRWSANLKAFIRNCRTFYLDWRRGRAEYAALTHVELAQRHTRLAVRSQRAADALGRRLADLYGSAK